MRPRGACFANRWPLLLLCGGLALAEAVALQVTGFRSALPLAPQISAPASFGAYHDLRWVFTYHWSWLSFGWQLIALVVFRTLVTVGIVAFAWPGRHHAPEVFDPAAAQPRRDGDRRRGALAVGRGRLRRLPRPARVYYPAAGELGWGVGAGWEVRLLLRMLRLQNPDFTASADMPLARSRTPGCSGPRCSARSAVGAELRVPLLLRGDDALPR